MKKLFLLLLALLPLVLLAQDKIINDPHAQARAVTAFHAIEVSTGIQLILKQGNVDAVAVSATDAEYRNRIKTEVTNGVLHIYYESNWWGSIGTINKQLKAYVSFKNIDKLLGSSGSYTVVDGSITGADLVIDLSSGAHFKGDIKVNGLSVDQSSGSKMDISGAAQALNIRTSSGAHFNGYGVASSKCDAHASSGSHIEVTVNQELAVVVSSGGGIRYKGNGVITRVSTGSGGSVRKNS